MNMNMKVNFNNLRKKACLSYDSLAKKLNKAISDYKKEYGDDENVLLIHIDDIQQEMDNLRMQIGSIAMCYDENNPDIKDVFEEAYPGDENMVCFNPSYDD